MARIDVKKSCGSPPLTLQLVGKRARSLPSCSNRAELIANGTGSASALHARATGSGNLSRPTMCHDSGVSLRS